MGGAIKVITPVTILAEVLGPVTCLTPVSHHRRLVSMLRAPIYRMDVDKRHPLPVTKFTVPGGFLAVMTAHTERLGRDIRVFRHTSLPIGMATDALEFISCVLNVVEFRISGRMLRRRRFVCVRVAHSTVVSILYIVATAAVLHSRKVVIRR